MSLSLTWFSPCISSPITHYNDRLSRLTWRQANRTHTGGHWKTVEIKVKFSAQVLCLDLWVRCWWELRVVVEVGMCRNCYWSKRQIQTDFSGGIAAKGNTHTHTRRGSCLVNHSVVVTDKVKRTAVFCHATNMSQLPQIMSYFCLQTFRRIHKPQSRAHKHTLLSLAGLRAS